MINKSSVSERQTMIHLLRSGHRPAEVATILQRSLAWVYKWRQRYYERQAWEDLQERSRAPRRCPRRIKAEVRQAICQARSELEAEAAEPGKLAYIGAAAVQARLRRMNLKPIPSQRTIERVLKAAGMLHPQPARTKAEVAYPHLEPQRPHQLIQVDIVTHFLPGGPCVACFNAVDVVSHYPTGQQFVSRRSEDAANFLLHLWQKVGIADYTQVDNEACFSGGFTHAGVLGQVVRLALLVGTELVFSPLRHPESNGTVERFHQDYNRHIWDKLDLPDLSAVQQHSPDFFETYRHSEHILALAGRCPAQVHSEQPYQSLPSDYQLPKQVPLTAGKVHFMRLVKPDHKISVLNLEWNVPQAQPGQGVWATLELSPPGAKLRVYDTAPDAARRTCLAEHPFPLNEPVQPLAEEFQKPMAVDLSWFGLTINLFRSAAKISLPAWISSML
ncbi:MAG: DDE-type integrase/transposase/recombinase [Anaerolineae bacterium]|nr:DDE-type integrase/transposase/recombinase [Anaerolineae bacterium]